MRLRDLLLCGAVVLTTAPALLAQISDPIPTPVVKRGLAVELKDVARLPDSRNVRASDQDNAPGAWARVNLVRELPDGRRFANDMRGMLYVLDRANQVSLYADVAAAFPFGFYRSLQSGFHNFTFHPDFARNGLFYTVHGERVEGNGAKPHFIPPGFSQADVTFYTVITEWDAVDPSVNVFKGTRRELLRIGHVVNSYFHPLGDLEFDPTARAGTPEYGLLYTSGSDMGFSNAGGPNANNPSQTQRLDTLIGAILRLDPRSPSVSGGVKGVGDYTVPPINKFAADGDPKTLGEIYAYGFRNAHRLTWDPVDRTMFAADIGMSQVEEINIVREGLNYGWMRREGIFDNGVNIPGGNLNQVYPIAPDILDGRTQDGFTYPVAMYDHGEGFSVTAGYPYRGRIAALRGKFIFGDILRGRLFAADLAALKAADDGIPQTVAPLEEIQLYVRDDNGVRRDVTLQQLIQGLMGGNPVRADLQLSQGADGEIYVTTRQDGMIRMLVPDSAPLGAKNGEWRSWGGDGATTRYSGLDQITRDNVKQLTVAWTWRSDNFGTPPEARSQTTPIMANGRLFFTAGPRRHVVAADPGTGETLWLWRNEEGERGDRAPRRGSGRGVAYWSDGREERVFAVTAGFRLVALDAKTGHQVRTFGADGVVDLLRALDPDVDLTGTIGNSSPPVIVGDTLVVGPALAQGARPASPRNTRGDIMAFDVRTGAKRWSFRTIPRRGEAGYETWLNGSAEYTGNAGVWTPFTVDEELGYVYLPVEAPTSEYYGGHRPGNNLFSSSLICVEAKTGRRVWFHQLVHHDIWDYDITSPPMLVDLTVNGRRVKAVAQMTKQSYVYVFDRVTGEPVWPIEERPVPQTDVPGEWTSPTQPIPTRPAPFDRVGISVDDLIDFTPELRAAAVEALKPYRLGPLYAPASLADAPDGTRGTIMLPGNRGGSNWNAGAVDPETGFLYVASVTRPTLLQLLKAPESRMDYVATALAPPLPTVDGLPLIKPPYGRITAYNLNTGEIVWQMANGDTPAAIRNHPKLAGIQVPRTGSTSHAGVLATRTLLFAGEGDGGQPMFRAHDKATGEILWEAQVAAGVQTGLPMTYLHRGKQYVAFATGGGAGQTPPQIVAYALPDAPAR